MKDYRNMSDFEINQAVTCELNGCNEWSVNRFGNFYHCCFDGSQCIEVTVVDYCNSPSGAWPIIKSNHINIGWAGDEEWFARTVHTAKVFDANPLRAAMIVYLMMKDEEK